MPGANRYQGQPGWNAKFRNAFRGLWLAVRDQNSFRVHGVFTAAVVAAAGLLRVGLVSWCVLVLCITMVLLTELLNTALEWMAQAVDRRENPRIGVALDIASAAVLVSAAGAVVVGAIIFLHRLAVVLS